MADLTMRPKSTTSSQQEPAVAAPTRVGQRQYTNESLHRIRIKNRRKRYLDLHPEYFHSPELELAHPQFYYENVHRYLTPQEREQEGRARSVADVLEANLLRSEAKARALRGPDANPGEATIAGSREDDTNGINDIDVDGGGGGGGEGLDSEGRLQPMGKDVGWTRWVDVMQQRFLRGDDTDFDYSTVDGNDDYNDHDEEDRERFEEWLADESNDFLCDGSPSGETGEQDF